MPTRRKVIEAWGIGTAAGVGRILRCAVARLGRRLGQRGEHTDRDDRRGTAARTLNWQPTTESKAKMSRKIIVTATAALTICATALVIWIRLATPVSVVPSLPSVSSTTVPPQNVSGGSVNPRPPLTVHRLPVFHKVETPDDIPPSIPITWAGDPIDVKVLLFHLSGRLNRPEWAVADLAKIPYGFINTVNTTCQNTPLTVLCSRQAEMQLS